MSRPAVEIVLSEKEEAELRQWIRRRTMPVGLHLRASIVIDCAEGYSGETIAQRHHTSKQTVSKWRGRFARGRLAGLSDAPRSGQPRKHDDGQVQAVLEATLNRKPKKATHWRVRSLSDDLGMPRDFVHRVWRAFGLKSHLSHSFKLSTDPHCIEKVRDIVGLYLDPPDKALVLCVDEKSQIRALDRTQPSLPMNFGLPESRTRLSAIWHHNAIRGFGRGYQSSDWQTQATPQEHGIDKFPAAHGYPGARWPGCSPDTGQRRYP